MRYPLDAPTRTAKGGRVMVKYKTMDEAIEAWNRRAEDGN